MEIKKIISNLMQSNSYCLVSDNEFLIVECSHGLDEIRDLVGEFDFIDKNNQKIENSNVLGNNYSQNEMHSTMRVLVHRLVQYTNSFQNFFRYHCRYLHLLLLVFHSHLKRM